ncbi:GGDEF domain-containing protein [Paenibacillus nicotianae]|uniref:GGDEF domain-containing protein n=1 Tax=Paenibacillus nicotianae TaxID=1526551 RepID=A0ABW4UMQ4_9BACL
MNKQSKWIYQFFRVYWIVISVHFFAQWGSFVFLDYNDSASHFYIYILILPTLWMSIVTLITKWMYIRWNHLSFYVLFSASTLITWTIIYLNYDIRIITALCLLPILSAVVFFKRRLLWLPSILQLIAFTSLYLTDSHFRNYLSSFDVIAVIAFIIVSTCIAHIIVACGIEILTDLQTTMLAKQDLIVKNAIMSKLSKTDGLTNLYNQISFRDYYNTAFDYASKGAKLHLALLDIDDFKAINDTYGHQAGDAILGKVSEVIQQHMSSSDIAARYGGEEFALLLFDQTFEEAYALVESIRSGVADLQHPELNGKSITVSIGLQSYGSEKTKEQLFEQVDHYLYQAKRTGKNKTVTASNTG